GHAEPFREVGARPVPVVLQQGQEPEGTGACVRHVFHPSRNRGQKLAAIRSSVGLVRAVLTRERNGQMTSSDGSTLTGERADLLTMLGKARHWLRFTARDLTDEQARQRTTASELTIGGLIKHVTAVERNWARFIVHGPSDDGPDFSNLSEADYQAWADA